MTPLPLSRFTLHDGTLVAEASDLTGGMLRRLPFDANGHLEIKSEKTGRIEKFYIDRIEHDREGDLMAWYLKPCNSALKTVIGVTIFND